MDVLGVMAWDWAGINTVSTHLSCWLPGSGASRAPVESSPKVALQSSWNLVPQLQAQLHILPGACVTQPAPARLVGKPGTRHAPTASRVYGCKASLDGALPDLAFSEQQGQALPRLLCLPSCYPDDKKRNLSLRKGARAWRRYPSSLCTEDTPRAQQVLPRAVALPLSPAVWQWCWLCPVRSWVL